MTDTDAVDIAALSALPTRRPQRARSHAWPRFEGDVSELPDRACWALQNLMTRRYISADSRCRPVQLGDRYRGPIGVRLSELDLRLRVVEWRLRQRRHRVRRAGPVRIRQGVKLLRREPLGTYDSILALHLAQLMRASSGQNVVISRDGDHGMFTGVPGGVDPTVAFTTARIDAPSPAWPGWTSCAGPDDEGQHRQPGDHRGDDGLGDHWSCSSSSNCC